jgi:hypothetical protein
MSNAIAIADAFVQRPAQLAAGRKPRLQRQRVGFPRFEFGYREHPTGGLRQSLPVARARIAAGKRLRFATAFCIPRGAYAPRSWCSANVCRGKNDLCDARTRIRKSGGRQPAVVGDTMGYRKNRALFADSRTYQQERRVSARRGSGNAVATVSVHRPPTGRLCATIAVLPLQARFSNHGWLTSGAPGCPRADCCRKAVAIGNGVLYPTGGLRPPLLRCSANVCRRKNDLCDARTRIPRSGGRQPAVGMSNAVAIADAFVQRPASACRWSETTVATATRWISAFQVRIPRTSHGGLTPPALTLQCECLSAKKRFVRCRNARSQERRASARRGYE